MNRPVYNVLKEKCIQTTDGKFSLLEVLLNAHEIKALSGNPLEQVSILRLLLVLIHSVFRGPRSLGDWVKMHEDGKFDDKSLKDYFSKYEYRFDLFHPETPFLQVSPKVLKKIYKCEEKKSEKKGIQLLSLVFDNNGSLAQQVYVDEPPVMTPEKAFLALIGYLNFAIPMLGPNNKVPSRISKDPIFTLYGDSLFQTIMLNLVIYDGKSSPIKTTGANDKPFWEADIDDYQLPCVYRGGKKGTDSIFGYLDFMSRPSRLVYLIPQSNGGVRYVYQVNGWTSYSIKDPMKKYNQKGFPLKIQEANWKFISSIVNPKMSGFRQLEQLATTRHMCSLKQRNSFQIRTYGHLWDQATPIRAVCDTIPIPAEWTDDDEKRCHDLNSMVGVGGKAKSFLSGIEKTLYCFKSRFIKLFIEMGLNKKKLDVNGSNRLRDALRHLDPRIEFNSSLETIYQLFFTKYQENPKQAKIWWMEQVRKCAEESIDFTEGLCNTTEFAAYSQARPLAERMLFKHCNEWAEKGIK